MNWYPMYFGTGGKILEISDDWKFIKIRLKLNLWTRNYVDTIFGGSMFSASDPFYMLMFMHLLGKERYVVWDKGGSIQFIKPGKEAIYVEFVISDEHLKDVKTQIDTHGKYEWHMHLEWKTKDGTLISLIDRKMWGETKEYYEMRRKK